MQYNISGTEITHFDTEAAVCRCFSEIRNNFAIFTGKQLCMFYSRH